MLKTFRQEIFKQTCESYFKKLRASVFRLCTFAYTCLVVLYLIRVWITCFNLDPKKLSALVHLIKPFVIEPIAVGGIAAFGAICLSYISVGSLTAGILSIGAVSFGILSIGAVSFGILSIGAVSFGILSIGEYAFGIIAVGERCACGIYTLSFTGAGKGLYVLSPNRQDAEAVALFTRWLPKFKKIFSPSF